MTPLIDDSSTKYTPVSQTKDKGIDPHSNLFEHARENEEIQELDSCISCVVSSIFCIVFPFTCCCSIKKVTPMHDTIVTQCGIPTQILRQPGP